MSRIPNALRSGLMALAVLTAGGGGYVVAERDKAAAQAMAEHYQYIHAVAIDTGTSEAVKIAMVMGSYYESSYRHIGTPYGDKLGKGQPLTVCNGITGRAVVADRYYTPADCYALERSRYLAAERTAMGMFRLWSTYTPLQQAVFIDFIHNKGEGALYTSTLLRKANAGDVVGACRENPRWNRGTVNGVSVVLPGLQSRGDANGEICEVGL
ncbi:lysozyme [Comamonas sp. BIGb0152]|uniref:glycoside hydrolase family protein n=1 Tax=Comamonas sp. BIGb0152 TaxID=2940601 RepID=UPI002167D6EC|nr:glycoside hydrolase family protein [Comamonas sp. BIGb0152]MCS4292747.1 lysozyme [Comamonas sp. BIGb0152]